MILPGLTNAAKEHFIRGVHQASHSYRIALYAPGASLSPMTKAYTPSGEIVAPGYIKGGKVLSGYETGLMNDTGFITFKEAKWESVTITAEGAIIYNDSLPGKDALFVIKFQGTHSATNGDFVVQFPSAREGGLFAIS